MYLVKSRSWLLRFPETSLTKERNDDDHNPYAAVYRTGDTDDIAGVA